MPKYIDLDPRQGKKAVCGSCGHEWIYGKNGSHSCIDVFERKVAMLEHRCTKLFEVAKERSAEGYCQTIIEHDVDHEGVIILNADGREISKCYDLEKTPIEQFIIAIDALPEPVDEPLR
jgi:hypothetical protein